MACAPNTPVKWSDVYAISSRIDALAATLNTPGYTDLVDEPDMPFKFPDLVNFSGAIRFAVSPGTVTVTQQHLSDGVMLTAAHNLDPVLNAMGQANELFLVVEEDGCWCKTIFQIDTTPGVPRVKEVTDLGCCQSLFVPQPGDDLDYSQHIIPAAHAITYASTGNPDEGALWRVRPACVAETVSSGFKFQSTDLEAPLTDCTREITSAKFTWPMKASYMSKMIEKLKYILDCENSGGAKEDAIETGNPDPDYTYVWENCEVTICALVKDRVERALMDYSTPGCVSQGCSPVTPPSEPTAYPWDTPTCGGTNCDSNGPKYYCRTLEDLEAILDIAETGIHPYDPPTNVCGPCVCTVSIECEGRSGYAETCMTQFSAFLFYTQTFEYWTYERLTGPDLPEECSKIITITHSQEYRFTECQTGVVDIGDCSSSEENSNPGCPPDDGEVWSGDVEIVSTVGPVPSYIADAIAAHNACTTKVPGICQSLYYDGYGEAEVSSFRWRVRVDGSWSCTGTPPSVTVDLKRVANNAGAITETDVTATASWDSGEQTLVSPWVDEAIPSAAARGSSNSVYMVYVGPAGVRCPKPCTQV